MSRRVAVVTGSNKGVGLGIVRALCKKFDGDVYLTSRTESLGQEAVRTLQKEGLNPKYHQLDITDHDSIVRLRDFLKANYSGLDVLVNNAGIAYKPSSTAPFSEQAEVTIKTNYFGTLDTCDVLFPLLRPHARVCNISSLAFPLTFGACSPALQHKFKSDDITTEQLSKIISQFVESAKKGDFKEQGFPESAYGMSKLGVSVMTRIHQRELDKQGAEDLVVNSCCPGFVETEMSTELTPERAQGVTQMLANMGHDVDMTKRTVDEGAATPVYLALLPPSVSSPRGEFVSDKKIFKV